MSLRTYGGKWLAGLAIVALVVGGVAAYLLTQNTPSSYQPRSLPVVAPSVTPSRPVSASPGVTAAVARSQPVRLIIPSIGVNAPVDPEGTDSSGHLQVPPLSGPQSADVGWWKGGWTPGQAGPSVLAGHIDSAAMGHLVFWNLGKLSKGDTAQVRLADGKSVTFTVTATQEVSKSDPVFWPGFWKSATQPAGGPTLRLITCGGDFNPATGHYDDNLIVYLNEVPASG